MKTPVKKIMMLFLIAVGLYFLIPQPIINPVEGATSRSYNHKTFWVPWGDHHHHGIDIFAAKGTPIHSACSGLVIKTTHGRSRGGNTVSVLGLHGRIYYYAHLDNITTHPGSLVSPKSVIGTVGNTGNAARTPSHCHFSILTFIPRFEHWIRPTEWKMKDDAVKIFFVNPVLALDGRQIW